MIPKCWLNRCLQFGLMGLVVSVGAILPFSTSTFAQVVADPSIGTIVTSNGTTFQITGGTTVGNKNLFHSFSLFDVPTNSVVNFQNNPNVANIFSRVTGGTASQIDGIVRSTGTANLFLMNPSGIVFGQNARLDVGGSFVATTANAIQFGDRGVFIASIFEPPSQLLTIDPSAFLFNQINAAPIQSSSPNLFVKDGQSLVFLGGDITLDNGFLGAAVNVGGRVELGGLAAPGKVDLAVNDGIFRLSFPSNVLRGDIALQNGSTVNVLAGSGGSIAVHARNLTLSNGSTLEAGIDFGLGNPTSQAGDITVDAVGAIRLSDSSQIANGVLGGIGNSGNVQISGQTVDLVNGGIIASFSAGQGNAGSVTIRAKDTISFSGKDQKTGRVSGILGTVASVPGFSGEGNGGDIILQAPKISLQDSARIAANNVGAKGNAGNVIINAGSLEVTGGAGLQASTSGQGNAGNVIINAISVSATEGAQFSSSTFGQGNAGNVMIQVTGDVTFDGVDSNGNPSATFSSVEAGAVGNGGSINVTADSLSLTNGGQLDSLVRASSDLLRGGQGLGGTVNVNVQDAVTISGKSANGTQSGISTSLGSGAVGRGGDINITASTLSIASGAQLAADTSGKGDAGNILMQIAGAALFNGTNATNTVIFSNVSQPNAVGNGGNVTLKADSVVVMGGAQLNSFTRGQGNAGNITIQAIGNVTFDGVDTNGKPSATFSSVEAGAVGNGGSINITADSLSLTNGGQLTAIVNGASDTLPGGQGIGGTMNVNVQDAINISGKSANGTQSGIFTYLGPGAVGRGGNINITAGSIFIADSAQLSSATSGRGDAGNILINAKQDYRANNGQIIATAAGFGGGNIDISAKNIFLRHTSDITTFSRGGNGGNITLNAQTIVALENSDILAFAPAGRGGNITFNTRAFLSDPLYRPSPSITDRAVLDALLTNGRVDVNASGTVGGTVNGVPDISFLQNSLTQLTTSLTDTTQLLANSCIVRRGQQNGSFTITGSGGLPQRPGDALVSSFPTGEVRTITETGSASTVPSTSEVRPWKIGDPIVEPQGVYQLANGELVMSRDCK